MQSGPTSSSRTSACRRRGDEGIQAALRLRETQPGRRRRRAQPVRDTELRSRAPGRRSERRAYLLKERVKDVEQLVAAIRAVAEGGSVMDPKVVEALVAENARSEESPLSQLTPRERDVLREMAEGKNNAAIAESLFLTERSVEKVIHSIFLKLGLTWEPAVHKRVKAVILYLAESPSVIARAEASPRGVAAAGLGRHGHPPPSASTRSRPATADRSRVRRFTLTSKTRTPSSLRTSIVAVRRIGVARERRASRSRPPRRSREGSAGGSTSMCRPNAGADGRGAQGRRRAHPPRAAVDRSVRKLRRLLQRSLHVTAHVVEQRPPRGSPVDQLARELEVDRERDQVLLRTVVELALDPASLDVVGDGEPLARRAARRPRRGAGRATPPPSRRCEAPFSTSCSRTTGSCPSSNGRRQGPSTPVRNGRPASPRTCLPPP